MRSDTRFVCSYIYLEPTLPSVTAMKNNELAVPLRVYANSGELIAQIGEQRRNPVRFEQIPDIVKNAFIAAEDDEFFEHHGFDWKGILRTLFVNATSADFAQGAQHDHHAGGAQRVLHAGTVQSAASSRKSSSRSASSTISRSRKFSRCIST